MAASQAGAERVAGSRGFSFGEILVLGLWIGLLGGLCEGAMLAVARLALNRAIHTDPLLAWEIPISLAALCGVVAIAAGLLGRTPAGQRRPALPLWILCFVAAGNLTLVFFQIHPLARVLVAAGIATQAAVFLARRRDRVVRLSRRTLIPLLAFLGLIAVGTQILLRLKERRALAALPIPAPASPNVLLIVLDTQRAIDLSLHGYARRTTPTLDALAREATVFDRAYATSSWTLSSHASMFTGRLPQELGVGWLTPLDTRHRTLAEAFAGRGYATAAFSANTFFVTRASGLSRGFAHFEDQRLTPLSVLLKSALGTRLASQRFRGKLFHSYQIPSRKTARHLREDLVAWLERAPADRPWFAFMNFFDAHNPYLPPAPFDTAFTGRRADWNLRNPMLAMKSPVTPANAIAERDAYDQAIAWQDHELNALLTGLDRTGRLRNTIVAVTADHGEEFGEHGLLEHGGSLYPAALWVPLILRDPSRGLHGVRVPEVVSLIDLPATLLSLADPARSRELPGSSLFLTEGDSESRGHSLAVGELPKGIGQPAWSPVSSGPLRSLTHGTWHYVRDAEGTETLMDLSARPEGRIVSLRSPEHRIQLERMRALLDSAMRGLPGGR